MKRSFNYRVVSSFTLPAVSGSSEDIIQFEAANQLAKASFDPSELSSNMDLLSRAPMELDVIECTTSSAGVSSRPLYELFAPWLNEASNAQLTPRQIFEVWAGYADELHPESYATHILFEGKLRGTGCQVAEVFPSGEIFVKPIGNEILSNIAHRIIVPHKVSHLINPQ